MRHICHKLLPLILAFLQRGCHVVKGQRQFLHFFGVVAAGLDTGGQLAVTKVTGGTGYSPQGGGLALEVNDHNDHGDQNYQNGHEHKDLRDPCHDLHRLLDGGGNDHDADVSATCTLDGHGHHIAHIAVQVVDQTGIHTSSGGEGALQVGFIHHQTGVLAAQRVAGADYQFALRVADHGIGSGYRGGHRQRDGKIPIGKGKILGVGLYQFGDDLCVLFQTLHRLIGEEIFYQHLQ